MLSPHKGLFRCLEGKLRRFKQKLSKLPSRVASDFSHTLTLLARRDNISAGSHARSVGTRVMGIKWRKMLSRPARSLHNFRQAPGTDRPRSWWVPRAASPPVWRLSRADKPPVAPDPTGRFSRVLAGRDRISRSCVLITFVPKRSAIPYPPLLHRRPDQALQVSYRWVPCPRLCVGMKAP
jgi:hypothetical protein